MANNRMALVCKKCNLGIAIAKFYPVGGFIAGSESGWGQYPLNTTDMPKFFSKHKHEYDASMWGGNQYDLRYEIDDNSWEYDQLQDFEYNPIQVNFSKESIKQTELQNKKP